MKQIILIFFLVIFKFNLNALNYLNDSIDAKKIMMDSIKKITPSKFDSLVEQYTRMIQTNSEFSIDETIEIVRLYNTISFSQDIAFQRKYEKFYNLFLSDFLIIALGKLHATTWRFGSFYSSMYQIYIDGKRDSNSMFLLEL